MKITAQLSGVNRPLSVEFRLIHFCSCDFDSQEEHDTSSSRGVLTKRSDFCSAQGLVRHSPFGGVEFGKKPGRYRRFAKKKRKKGAKKPDRAQTQETLSSKLGGTKKTENPQKLAKPRPLSTGKASL